MWNCSTPDSLEAKKQLSAENWYVMTLKTHGVAKACSQKSVQDTRAHATLLGVAQLVGHCPTN